LSYLKKNPFKNKGKETLSFNLSKCALEFKRSSYPFKKDLMQQTLLKEKTIQKNIKELKMTLKNLSSSTAIQREGFTLKCILEIEKEQTCQPLSLEG